MLNFHNNTSCPVPHLKIRKQGKSIFMAGKLTWIFLPVSPWERSCISRACACSTTIWHKNMSHFATEAKADSYWSQQNVWAFGNFPWEGEEKKKTERDRGRSAKYGWEEVRKRKIFSWESSCLIFPSSSKLRMEEYDLMPLCVCVCLRLAGRFYSSVCVLHLTVRLCE